MYVVTGSSGAAYNKGSFNHSAMYFSLVSLGSLVLDIDGGRLDAKFLDAGGKIRDHFTLSKGMLPVDSELPSAPTGLHEGAVDPKAKKTLAKRLSLY